MFHLIRIANCTHAKVKLVLGQENIWQGNGRSDWKRVILGQATRDQLSRVHHLATTLDKITVND